MSHSRSEAQVFDKNPSKNSPPATRARSSRDTKASAPTLSAGYVQKVRAKRKVCGPLAQLLREQREADRAQVTVCRGGFTIDAHGSLWHDDCHTHEDGRAVRPAPVSEVPA